MPIAHVRIIWIALMTSTAVLCVAAASASAQDSASGFARARTVETYRPARSRTQPDGLGDSAAAADVPSPIPSDDAPVMPQDGDDSEPQSRSGQRTVRQDGDLSDPEAPMLRDGVIETGEPAAPVDGGDPTMTDSRPPEEAQLFEAPAPQADALLFQVEELDPILDRRPQRLFRFEPYDPVGVRVGSFVLFPEYEFGIAANSNVFRASKARSDTTFDVRPSARLVSNWQRHALEFSARGTASLFTEFSSENEKSYTLEARGRIDLTKRTNLQTSLSRDVAQESRLVLEARSAASRADVTTDVATAALNHRFNRLSMQLRGSVTDRAYGDSSPAGAVVANDARDYTTYEQAVRASWEFKPTLSAFADVAINQRDYKRADSGGVDRSSAGERYRAGLSFGNTGEFLRGEIGAGWGVQHLGSSNLPDVSGVIVDANLTYRPNALTSFAFAARSDFGETASPGVGGVRSQFVGADVRHAFQRNLIGTAGLGYTVSTYAGSTLSEEELRSTLGLEYFLNRETVLFSKYVHTAFGSNAADASYDVDEVRVGLRIRR